MLLQSTKRNFLDLDFHFLALIFNHEEVSRGDNITASSGALKRSSRRVCACSRPLRRSTRLTEQQQAIAEGAVHEQELERRERVECD